MESGVRLGHVILAVRNLERAVSFYRDAFGWPQTVGEPVYAEFVIPGDVRLGLYHHEAFGRCTGQLPRHVAPGDLGGAELYFYADDVAAAIERVVAAGGRKLSPLTARAWGDEAAYFADPEGNVVVIARRVGLDSP